MAAQTAKVATQREYWDCSRCIDKEGEVKDWINGILFLDTQSVISVFLKMADEVVT
jgi:hypothetical protein